MVGKMLNIMLQVVQNIKVHLTLTKSGKLSP